MEYLYLKWISNKTGKKHVIGALCRKNAKYFQGKLSKIISANTSCTDS